MKFQSALLIASAALPAAFAQTFTACNPLNETCPCDDALGTTYSFDFTKGQGSDIFPPDPNFTVKYESDGVHLIVAKKGDAPTLTSTKYIFGGRLDCVLKIAPGGGIVSSMVFESNDLDEIDFEWIGSRPLQAQTNYFGKGNTQTYNRGATSPINTDASQNFHQYSVEWTQEQITWYIDGQLIRTLTPAISAQLYQSDNYYPQTPMQIKIGAWAAGDPSNSPGVVQWSDGPINYSNGPFEMVVQSVTLTDYTTGASQYCYGDKTGSWGSIVLSNSTDTSSSSTTPSQQNTLVTSTSTSSTTSQTPTSSNATVTMQLAPAITHGMPNSIGVITPEVPQDKGVSSTSQSPSGTAQAQAESSGPATTSIPSSASSVRSLGFGGIIAAIIAALVL